MLKYIIPGIILAVILLIIFVPRLLLAKYNGSTIRIFNKTFKKRVSVNYVAKICNEREQVNIIKYPHVNSLFLCKPNKDAKEKYYTYSRSQGRLFFVEEPRPALERKNTLEKSYFHEIILKPFDKLVLAYVFRMYS